MAKVNRGHFQTQMAAVLTHFPQVSDPLVAKKDQIRGVMRVEMRRPGKR